MVAINFNAQAVAPNVALTAIPSGVYPVMITNTVEKPTKANNGSFLEVEMQIQGGEFNGRKVFDRLNLKNANQTAVDIAYSTLSAICHVTGVLHLQDTQQLHGRPFKAVVIKAVRNDLPPPGPGQEPTYSNNVTGYKDMNGNDPGFAGAAPAQQQAAPGWAAPAAAPAPAYAPPPPAPAGYAPPAAPAPTPAPALVYTPPAGVAPQPAQAAPAGYAAPPAPPAAGATPPWLQPAAG